MTKFLDYVEFQSCSSYVW